jgi:hypothetical protein
VKHACPAVWLLIALWLTSASTVVADDTAPRAVLVPPSCAIGGLSEDELRTALRLELRTAGVELVEPGGVAGELLLEIVGACGGGEVVIRAVRPSDQHQRAIDLAEVPEHVRVRVVTLALAGLVESVLLPAPAAPARNDERSAAAAKPPAEADTSDRTPAPVDRGKTATLPAESRFSLGVQPELRWFMSSAPLLGGRIYQAIGEFRFGIGRVAASTPNGLGLISVETLQAFGAWRGAESELSPQWTMAWEPRIGLGYIAVDAEAYSGTTATGSSRQLYIDVASGARLDCRVTRWLRLGAALEIGAARGVVALADDREAAAYDGIFAGFLADLALVL